MIKCLRKCNILGNVWFIDWYRPYLCGNAQSRLDSEWGWACCTPNNRHPCRWLRAYSGMVGPETAEWIGFWHLPFAGRKLKLGFPIPEEKFTATSGDVYIRAHTLKHRLPAIISLALKYLFRHAAYFSLSDSGPSVRYVLQNGSLRLAPSQITRSPKVMEQNYCSSLPVLIKFLSTLLINF